MEGLILPAGLHGNPLISDFMQLVRIMENQPISFPWPPLRSKPRIDGGFDVGIDLLTVDRRHSQLVVETLNRRFPRKLALVRELMKESGIDLVK